jgi:hypothetical protein
MTTDNPTNDGHRFGIKFLGSDTYVFADAIKIDPVSGDSEWYCVYPDHITHGHKKGDQLIYDYKPQITLEDFLKKNPERLIK